MVENWEQNKFLSGKETKRGDGTWKEKLKR